MRDVVPFDLTTTVANIAAGRPVLFDGIDVTVCTIHGRQFCFASDRARDPIQRKQRKGKFYEAAELDDIKSNLPLGGVFVDIGANIGNHSLFVAGFMQPKRIIPFEPNSDAYKLLLANVAMNGFGAVFDLQFLGLGISDTRADGFGIKGDARNLGGVHLAAGTGDISTIVGDDALAGVAVDMIKIDVEGMEMQVLRGLGETFKRCQPTLLIEVDDINDADFHQWVGDVGYAVRTRIKRYDNNTNYLLKPAEAG